MSPLDLLAVGLVAVAIIADQHGAVATDTTNSQFWKSTFRSLAACIWAKASSSTSE